MLHVHGFDRGDVPSGIEGDRHQPRLFGRKKREYGIPANPKRWITRQEAVLKWEKVEVEDGDFFWLADKEQEDQVAYHVHEKEEGGYDVDVWDLSDDYHDVIHEIDNLKSLKAAKEAAQKHYLRDVLKSAA